MREPGQENTLGRRVESPEVSSPNVRAPMKTRTLSRTSVFGLVAGLLLLMASACNDQPRVVVLLDSVSWAPVPGALVYAPGELTVYRSDVHGAVTLPAGYGPSGINLFAKNYQPRELSASESAGEILLTFDESLVNPGEARMVFDKADTLRGTYGPYRENNDLLSYDLNIKVDVEEEFLF